MTTYTKLEGGGWGVRTDHDVKVGDVVCVFCKNGTSNMRKIKALRWTGPIRGCPGKNMSICEVFDKFEPAPAYIPKEKPLEQEPVPAKNSDWMDGKANLLPAFILALGNDKFKALGMEATKSICDKLLSADNIEAYASRPVELLEALARPYAK